MVISENGMVICHGKECRKIKYDEETCAGCPLDRIIQQRHKLQCASCEHRLLSGEANTKRHHSFDEYYKEDGQLVTIFAEGTWTYEDAFRPDYYRMGTWNVDRRRGVLFVETLGDDNDASVIEAVREALAKMGYAKT